ncbi:MAG TPA: hypothetical protein VMH83_05000 [Candidatus Acidoferrum sp.]|nr:hypothetical protein [Candidatus Acidoferrum sp.]
MKLIANRLQQLTVISPLAALLVLAPLAAHAQDDAVKAKLDELQAKIQELDNVAVRTQSHSMIDVEYNFSNLWFAAGNGQWDLAAFYGREAQSHIAWTVRMRPVRNIRGGGTVELKPFQQSIEQGGFTPIQAALEKKDLAAFKTAYQTTLTICHSCHEASGLGYLDPKVPTMPLSPLMLHKQ